ncbi:MFS transporter [Thermopolyspora sp. NPDC052614]|uniref:MFS transporter n=1 Tax=Thermopolyspora sp. NPDC052614 TaxID=3155682 RepID=UPI00342BDCD3
MTCDSGIAPTGAASSLSGTEAGRPAAGVSRGALAVPSVAQFLLALDYSIIYVALPSIARDLALDPALAQWVISAYAVPFAGFLMAGGRLADRLGVRRLFIAAITLFGAAGAVGGLAGGGGVLLAARGAQGFAAALLQPAVLGLIGTMFPAGPSRSRALAVWGAVGASGLAAGAILGGLLTTSSWRLTFLINVPLALWCALAARARVGGRPGPENGVRTQGDACRPASPSPHQRRRRSWSGRGLARKDLWGRGWRDVRGTGESGQSGAAPIPLLASVLGTTAALAIVGGLTLGAQAGWSAPPTLGTLAVGLVALGAFAVNEVRSRHVLIERVLRGTRSLGIGSAAAALYMASVGSEFYLVTLLLQAAKGYGPLAAGLAFLPLAAMVTAGSMAAGRAVRRLPAHAVLAAGFAVAAVGLGWLATALHGDSYAAHLLPGLVLSGAGHGVIYTSMFIIGTGEVPAEHQGTAGALITTSQYLAAALTVAALTLVLGSEPGDDAFRAAFLGTAVAAAAGVALALLAHGRRRWRGHGDRAGTR